MDYESGYIYSWNLDKLRQNQKRYKKTKDIKGDNKPHNNEQIFLDKTLQGQQNSNGEPKEGESGGTGPGRTRLQRKKTQEQHPTMLKRKTNAQQW